jgi:tagatose 6-phosphate kinase
MITVLNLNAAVDKRYQIEDIKKGKVMRAKSVENTAGGKGLNVGKIANILGEDVVVSGFLGGKTGEFIEDKVREMGITGHFTKVQGSTRECLAFITEDLEQTEILEPGPEIKEEELNSFIEKYDELLRKSTIVVASGSVPKNVPKDIYKTLIEKANKEGKKFLLDTSGELLLKGIEAKPFFIKPNEHEIEMITGCKVTDQVSLINEIKKLRNRGIACVVVSLGKDGSLIGYGDKIYKVTVPKVNAVNPIGSGDSFVGGFAVGLERNYDIKDIIALATACGTANAVEAETGFVRKEIVDELIRDIKILVVE